MASAARSSSARKRRASDASVHGRSACALVACALCSLPFDENEAARVPRLLACGHAFCTACVGARAQQPAARRDGRGRSSWHFTCPAEALQTPLVRGDASSLDACVGLVSSTPPLFRIDVRNLAGDSTPLFVDAEHTVGDLKRMLHAANSANIVRLQRLLRFADDGDAECAPLDDSDDTRTLGALGIGAHTRLAVFVRDGFRGGEFLRTMSTYGVGRFRSALGACVSPDGALLFVADTAGDRVRVLRAADGAHVRSLASGVRGTAPDQLFEPTDVCVSSDGALALVADSCNNRVQVLSANCGALVRTLGTRGTGDAQFRRPTSLCVHDGVVFVADQLNRRVQALRIADGAHVRTFSAACLDTPEGVCTSTDGKLLFVADCVAHQVHIFQISDGVHVRSLGFKGAGDSQFDAPIGVCTSACGEWLFVADSLNDRVQVLRASDGAHALSIPTACPTCICASPDGRLIFVISARASSVAVFAGGSA